MAKKVAELKQWAQNKKLKMLGNPEKAKKGNLIAAFGMGIAIFGTIFLYENNGKPLNNYAWIFGGLIVGSIIGTMMAKKVKMTGMPQMVSFFNGMGGACAALISFDPKDEDLLRKINIEGTANIVNFCISSY